MTTMEAKAGGRTRSARQGPALADPAVTDSSVMEDGGAIDVPPDFVATFIAFAQENLRAARLVLERRGAEDPDEPAMLAEIYTVSHDLKGQGSSFGYPLITRTGASLCRLLKGRRDASEGEMALVETHLATMETIFELGLTGSSTAIANALIARLEALVERMRPT